MSAVAGMLVVDKPRGPTSHDVVQRVRRAFRTRSVGHAGTLDPMATGVLVVAVGEATKLVAHLAADDKVYEATVTLGTATDTLDAEGAITATAEVPPLSEAAVRPVLAGFVGPLAQRAPRVSAIKVQGRALHERVRRGEHVEAPVRQVWVHSIDLLAVDGSELRLRVHSGKGFYVRSLARDVAEALGTVGHLSALRRTRSGAFDLDQAVDLASIERAAVGDETMRARLGSALVSLEGASAGMPQVPLTDQGVDDARHGRPVLAERTTAAELPESPPDAAVALLDPEGRLVALARRDGSRLRVVRGIRQSC
ncbi:MAG: tRNA pseudouridine(55) synthase TruB [Myxococcota bacterium]